MVAVALLMHTQSDLSAYVPPVKLKAVEAFEVNVNLFTAVIVAVQIPFSVALPTFSNSIEYVFPMVYP